jgi:glutathione S-transferase
MILVGRYLSPYTRRVGATLKIFGMPYVHKPASTITERDVIQSHNPLGRVPALVLDDGETLIESAAILDHLDEVAGPAKALIPTKGIERRRVLQILAVATGVLDKAVAGVYERTRKSKDKVDEAWAARQDQQVLGGLAALEAACTPSWFVGARMTQADVTVKCVVDFLKAAAPALFPTGAYPRLEAFAQRLAAHPAFAETPIEA